MEILTGVIGGLFQLVGSLGLFLFGMKLMGDGLQNSAGERMQTLLGYMTRNRVTAVLTGLGITSVIQSSSATTVFVVSFVNAGLLTLQQAIGVIMGANIGTTVTAWIVATFGFKFDIVGLAIPAIAVGLPFIFMKSSSRKSIGETLIGFGLLFMGLMYLKKAVPDIKGQTEVLQFIGSLSNHGYLSHILFVLIGTVITVIVQSSSAAMAITLTMANAGWIDFPTAAALCLGENIGTTITAQLAALSQNRASKQAAMAHTMFNVIGVVWVLLIFPLFTSLVDMIIPGAASDPANMPLHISMFHTLFNVTNTLIFIWFVPFYSQLIERMVPADQNASGREYRLPYVRAALQDTPDINVLTVRTEVGKMSRRVCDMFTKVQPLMARTNGKEQADWSSIRESEDYVDQMQEELSRYIGKCMQEKPSDQSISVLGHLLKIVDDLESVADGIYNISRILEASEQKKLFLGKGNSGELAPFIDEVGNFLEFIQKNLNRSSGQDDLALAVEKEHRIDQFRDTLKKAARKRIQNGGDVKLEIMFIDIVEQLENIGDLSLDVSTEIRFLRT